LNIKRCAGRRDIKTLIIIVVIVIGIITLFAVRKRFPESRDTGSLLAQSLTELLVNHGIAAVLARDQAVVSSAGFALSGSIGQILQNPQGQTVQLDIIAHTPDGKLIVESFAGMGTNLHSAVKNGLENFTANSFHVLLSAYLLPNDERTTREEWTVAHRPRLVHVGTIGLRGQYPAGGQESNFWFPSLEKIILAADLPQGTHWVRFFFAQHEGKTIACEVLLDNELWEDAQKAMRSLPWPKAKEYYSVRIFLILKDNDKTQPSVGGDGNPAPQP
jgi:Family of unknown function (DUF6348)